jgi:hypothetical protein
MPDQADLGEERQIERAAKRNLVLAVESVRSGEPQSVVVVGGEIDEVLILYLADEF